MRNLASHTDAFFQPPGTTYKRRDGYAVVHTPDRRDYHFGNLLELDDPPGPNDLDRWLDLWQIEFGRIEGIEKRVLQWEVQWEARRPMDDTLREAARARGLEADSDDVLALAGHSVRSHPGVVSADVRPVADDREWNAVVEMVAADEEHADFARWRMEQYRSLLGAADPGGEWWVCWHDGKPVSSAGIFWRGDLLRFQWVQTASRARGRGFATALISAMLERHRSRGTAVIVAEHDSSAGRIYRRLGFEQVGVQEVLMSPWPPPPRAVS